VRDRTESWHDFATVKHWQSTYSIIKEHSGAGRYWHLYILICESFGPLPFFIENEDQQSMRTFVEWTQQPLRLSYAHFISYNILCWKTPSSDHELLSRASNDTMTKEPE